MAQVGLSGAKSIADRGEELQDEAAGLDSQMREKPARNAFTGGLVELSTISNGSTDLPELKHIRGGIFCIHNRFHLDILFH